MRNLQVNGGRLWASLMELARIGATAKGGVCRLAASDLDGEARGREPCCQCSDANTRFTPTVMAGVSRPSTTCGTNPAGFRGCPAQGLSSGRARRGPVGRGMTSAVSLHHLNASEH